MKNALATILFLFFGFEFYGSSNFVLEKQTYSPIDSVEVILSVNSSDVEIVAKVKSLLKNMPGVKYLAHCYNHSVFAIYIDTNVYSDKMIFLDKLGKDTDLSANRILFLKEGTIKDLMKVCSTKDAQEAAIIKQNFN